MYITINFLLVIVVTIFVEDSFSANNIDFLLSISIWFAKVGNLKFFNTSIID